MKQVRHFSFPPEPLLLLHALFAVSVDELVCTVGGKAIFPEMIPTDGLCDYIYYTNVAVVHGYMYGIETDDSWELFKLVMRNRTRTSGGIGFDIRLVTFSYLIMPNKAVQLIRTAAFCELENGKHLAPRNIQLQACGYATVV